MYRTAALAAAALLLLALADLPYGYYTFLRLVVCAVAAFGAFRAAASKSEVWAVVLGGVALLFNPIIPVHLDRETWAPIDVVTAAVLSVSALRVKEEREPS